MIATRHAIPQRGIRHDSDIPQLTYKSAAGLFGSFVDTADSKDPGYGIRYSIVTEVKHLPMSVILQAKEFSSDALIAFYLLKDQSQYENVIFDGAVRFARKNIKSKEQKKITILHRPESFTLTNNTKMKRRTGILFITIADATSSSSSIPIEKKQ